MFLRGFICGWIGMAAIVMALVWAMTPRPAMPDPGYTDYDQKSSYDMGFDYRSC